MEQCHVCKFVLYIDPLSEIVALKMMFELEIL